MPSALIDTSTDGAILVAAPGAGKQIRLLGWNIVGAGDVEVSFKSGSTVLWTSLATNADGSGIVIPMDTDRDLHCNTNEALTIDLSAAVRVTGSIDYCIDQLAT